MNDDFLWNLFKITGSIYAALYMIEEDKNSVNR